VTTTLTAHTNGHRPDLTGLSDAKVNQLAQADALADPSLTGPELGRRYGRNDRWGRRRIAAVRPDTIARAPAARDVARPADTPGAVTSTNGRTRPAQRARYRAARPRKAGQRGHQVLTAIATAGAVLVAVVTAVVSYSHVRQLAAAHGMGDLSGWLPLGVDGLVITCSCSLIIDRRSLTAWAGVVIGLVGSVAANILAAPAGDPVAQLMAAYSPVALAVAVHEVFRLTAKLARP
jgi:hypothetical protein